MASAEENVEEVSGRRTRSGRKVSASQPPVLTNRSSRRSSRKQLHDEQNLTEKPITAEDNGKNMKISLNHNKKDDVIAEVASEEIHEVVVNESNNSLDSSEKIFEEVAETHIYDLAQQGQQQQIEDVEMYVHDDAEVPVSLDGGIDEKSSSFPFGTIGHSETSEDAQNEDEISGSDRNENNAVESSLLASLAGDNANSLPSVGGGEDNEMKKDFEVKVIQSIEGNCEKLNSSDESVSEAAIAEDLVDAETSNATLVNTELVSEDELPLPSQPKVNYAEEVSDDELPAPKHAELPADAEVISEDELPPRKSPGSSPKRIRNAVKINIYTTSADLNNSVNNKRKAIDGGSSDKETADDASMSTLEIKKIQNEEQYNPMSPTSESDDLPPVEKKAKVERIETKYCEKVKDKDIEREKKKLPDLDKYWCVVREDPADFTGWTYLLQYVDNESDAEAAREAYDAFLSHYPYCYGYWRKYADFEKRKGLKSNSNAVFERGLDAIPLSVDLWIHYLTHVKINHSDNEEYLRSQFERAISACGLEFRSDKLWDAYIKWETDGKRFDRVLEIYDRLLAIPTQGYNAHFDSFQDLINQHCVTSLLSNEELNKLISELRESSLHSRSKSNSSRSSKERDDTAQSDGVTSDLKINDDSDIKEHNYDTKPIDLRESINVSPLTDEEIAAIKEKVVALRRKVHKSTVAAVTARWTYEEGIKRPYFHVKPLERSQLKNWNDYLDFEIERGDRKRIIVLFERCLIACALYDEFWLKMIRYLETQMEVPGNVAITADVFQRACEIHHPDKPSLHLMWSAFEECQNNFDRASQILENLESKCPNLLQVAYRRINIERRRGDLTKCKHLYDHYITNAKNKTIAGSLSIKYARFLNKICKDLNAGLQVLYKGLEKDPANTRVALQMIDLALQRDTVDEDEVVQIMDKFMARENMDPEQKVLFAQRKVEFLEDFGSTAKGLQDAQRALQLALNKANDAKKKRESSPNRKTSSHAKETPSIANSSGQATFNNGQSGAVNNTSYYNSANSAYYGQQNSGAYQQQQTYDGYYNHWQYGAGYGYGQWSGYGNYY